MEILRDVAKDMDLVYWARKIRELILKTTHNAGCGHTGGSLSEVEILTALFFRVMDIDTGEARKIDRDRFILSKGHATPGYYSTLALRGFFPIDEMNHFDTVGSILQAHPDMHKCPGVDFSSGSLGQGLSVGAGMAQGLTATGIGGTVFVLVGDGESQEGQIWEAAMYCGATRVRNIVCIVDYNKVQLASSTADAVSLEPLADKWKAFNWEVMECDGHDMTEIVDTISNAKKHSALGPVVVIAHTVKGKGVSFMEGKYQWHGKAPNEEEFEAAIKEISGGRI